MNPNLHCVKELRLIKFFKVFNPLFRIMFIVQESPCTVYQRVAGKVHQTLLGVGSTQTALRFQGSSDQNKILNITYKKKYFYGQDILFFNSFKGNETCSSSQKLFEHSSASAAGKVCLLILLSSEVSLLLWIMMS